MTGDQPIDYLSRRLDDLFSAEGRARREVLRLDALLDADWRDYWCLDARPAEDAAVDPALESFRAGFRAGWVAGRRRGRAGD